MKLSKKKYLRMRLYHENKDIWSKDQIIKLISFHFARYEN